MVEVREEGGREVEWRREKGEREKRREEGKGVARNNKYLYRG